MVADYPLRDQVEGATEFVQLTSTMPDSVSNTVKKKNYRGR
jgi:hypothetical protein